MWGSVNFKVAVLGFGVAETLSAKPRTLIE